MEYSIAGNHWNHWIRGIGIDHLIAGIEYLIVGMIGFLGLD